MGILQDTDAGDIGSIPSCRTCGSERVVRDAWACWNPVSGLWETERIDDYTQCLQCEDETELVWTRQEAMVQARVRELNDRFRWDGHGRGSLMLTSGIQEQGSAFAVAAIKAVRAFDAFTTDNDPWGEHDFGAVEVMGERVFFKLDYYDPTLEKGSENPANEGCTHRVLTIMLPSEY